MARPRRRRPTLPDHDPRAIRAALRREVYAIGDARRELDDIEFVAVGGLGPLTGVSARGLEVVLNGVRVLEEVSGRPVPMRLQYLPDSSLRDRDGTREVFLTACTCGILACGGERVRVHVTGRYVLWQTSPKIAGGRLVFDRAAYRRSLEAAMAEPCYGEDDEAYLLREVLSRALWGGAHEAGLEVIDAFLSAGEFTVTLRDPLWNTRIEARRTWPAGDEIAAVAATVRAIARWDLADWAVSWWPPRSDPEARPPYPPEWRKVTVGISSADWIDTI